MHWLRRGIPAVVLLVAFSGAAQARDYYGAIAYSKTTRAQGYVYDEGSQEDAESAALTSCSDLAPDCEPMTWFRNACGALAVSSEGAWGSAWGEDEATAEKKATRGLRRSTPRTVRSYAGSARRGDRRVTSVMSVLLALARACVHAMSPQLTAPAGRPSRERS